jgi:putative SOS response-associated peptidase YedK
MCVDLSFFSSIEVMADYLPELRQPGQTRIPFTPTFHQQAHAHVRWPLVINEEGKLTISVMEWGLIDQAMASLAQKERAKRRSSMVNARSERIFAEPWCVWNMIKHQRCLIPTTGFFEHKEIAGRKQPYFIRVKGERLFFMAGLYNYPPLPDVETGEIKGTFSMLTRSSNELLTDIHNSGENRHRMPLMLSNDILRKWLYPALSQEDMQALLNYEMPSDALEAWPVRTIRGRKEDNEKVIEPIQLLDQTSLF